MQEFDNGLDKKFKFDFSAPCSLDIDYNKLRDFLLKDENPVLIFYGGEPLLEIEKIIKIIDSLRDTNVRFRMQTNGKLLLDLPIEYLKKIDKILISIDGDKKRTDYNRGEGTYDKVISNIKEIRKQGYKGEIVARMTISQDFPDLYKQVLHLISLRIFDSIHWQIDAGFYKFDFNEEKFSKFVSEYNKNVTKLIDWWVVQIKQGNKILLYPFVDILCDMQKGVKTKLRCGAGYSGYNITTNGKIVACPIMNNIKDFVAGNLETDPHNLKKFEIKGKCLNCPEKDVCGGRCLYWNYAELWPKEGDELICKTIKYLINELRRVLPKVDSEIKLFEYEKYFGPEIIP
jgi:putative peptide-modifying radical SAM enzyme